MNKAEEQSYLDLISTLYEKDFEKTDSYTELGRDPFQTDQQRRRDLEITSLLKEYVKYYRIKSHCGKRYRAVLFWGCVSITFVLVAACIFAIVWWTVQKNKDMNDVIALVTACATLIGAIIGILKIITEYVFPREDEKYVTGIVESIQKNDLENKKTNMGAGMLK
jgi:hypothetical protein